jgi:hypothetical protein
MPDELPRLPDPPDDPADWNQSYVLIQCRDCPERTQWERHEGEPTEVYPWLDAHATHTGHRRITQYHVTRALQTVRDINDYINEGTPSVG